MIELLKRWWSFDAATYKAPDGVPSPDEPRKLVLFTSSTCGYCLRVMRVIDRTGVDVELRNVGGNPDARQELWDATSRTTVPCMFIDDVPMFESKDISHWLLAYAHQR